MSLAPFSCVYCERQSIRERGAQHCWDCHEQRRPFQRKANSAVSHAVAKGELPRLDGEIPCVDCGKPAQHYDHRDYSKPLDVAPVCWHCNRARGPAAFPMEAA